MHVRPGSEIRKKPPGPEAMFEAGRDNQRRPSIPPPRCAERTAGRICASCGPDPSSRTGAVAAVLILDLLWACEASHARCVGRVVATSSSLVYRRL